MRRATSILSLVALLGVGCGPEFLPATRIVDERVLAVVAEPPEAVPGQTVTFTALVASPSGTVSAQSYDREWWRCPDEDGDDLQDAVVCARVADREILSTAGVYEDQTPNVFILPEEGEAFDNTTLLAALLGYWRVVGVSAKFPGNTREAAKRVVISPPVRLDVIDERLGRLDVRVNPDGVYELNKNPRMIGVEIRRDGPDGPLVETSLQAGEVVTFVPVYDETALQAYFSLQIDLEDLDLRQPGVVDNLDEEELLPRFSRTLRCELPLFSWYTTAGDLRRENTVDEEAATRVFGPRNLTCPAIEGTPRNPGVTFTAPEKAGLVRGWVVLRDGRGGTDTAEFALDVVE